MEMEMEMEMKMKTEVQKLDWMNEIECWMSRTAEPKNWNQQSIYRVPRFVNERNPKAYKPQVVSFGPYHYGDPDLRAMEEHKERAFIHFLKQADKTLDDFWRGMKEILHQLLDSYKDLDQCWKRYDGIHNFLGVMIVDGCFMLEVMRVAARLVEHRYSSNDPIFSNHAMLYNLPYIRRDMLMFENQLPLLVLDKLVAVERGERADEGQINKLVLQFVSPNKTIPTAVVGLGLHPLDLYRKSLIQLGSSLELQVEPRIQEPSSSRGTIRSAPEQDGNRDSRGILRSVLELLVKVGLWKPAADSQPRPNGIIRSALELDEAGIRFKKSETESLRDITFDGKVLTLPVIEVSEFTEHVFLNLMQFERFHGGNEVTSYVFFMDNIISSAKDVILLRYKGIIINNDAGSDEAVANIFNTLPKNAGGFNSYSNHDEVNQKLNVYCQKKRNRWRKKWNRWLDNLIHTYFTSPWSFLSLAAAIILLALTVAQTVYTILSYYYR